MNHRNVMINFDLDDTLVKTRREIVSEIYTRSKGKVDLSANQDYLTDDNTHGWLSAILEDASFMRKTKPCSYVLEAYRHFRDNTDFKVGSVTHRGYSDKAREFTEPMLEEHGIVFDRVIYLDPGEFPDKLAYLDTLYHGQLNILLDDRPTNGELPVIDKRIVLFHQPWNRNDAVSLPNQYQYAFPRTSSVIGAIEAALVNNGVIL